MKLAGGAFFVDPASSATFHVKRWKQHRHATGYGHLDQGRYKFFPVETEDCCYWYTRSPKINDVLSTYAGTAYVVMALHACGETP